MLDIGWQELFLICVVALVVLGPKDLPTAMRAVARVVVKVRGLSREFQSGVADMLREAELDDLKRKVSEGGRVDLGKAVKDAVDPTGTLTEDFDPADFARRLKQEVEGGPPTGPRAAAQSPQADGPQPAAPEPAAPQPPSSEATAPELPTATPAPQPAAASVGPSAAAGAPHE
ncbi:Sec-independent protein translocase protein TatB [uncultured Defluviicoccus sp.]|uniref:Sec-independent protein translocase protein TatB n=1 Tax=metagenome TaxID=256318 RepID=A0A380TH15_9ZZZZ|nr:Sec-independent protein translocase protein TatB [uncultured Defluviicoccus sp.]